MLVTLVILSAVEVMDGLSLVLVYIQCSMHAVQGSTTVWAQQIAQA